jgi:isocitrate/isopropylmalate dehydrogenase
MSVEQSNGGRFKMAERSYKIALLPGDGIGPEIIKVAVDVLREIGSQEGESVQARYPIWWCASVCAACLIGLLILESTVKSTSW